MLNIAPKYLNIIVISFPNFLWFIKRSIIRKSLKKVGKNFRFGHNSRFTDHRLIEVGNNVFLGLDTVINTIVPVVIGNDVMFGPGVTIMGGDHNFSVVGKPMRQVKTGGLNLSVIIENDVWIGANVTILKGVTIGEGAVIGAGSLVTRSMPPYGVCVGHPCKVIKLRFSEEKLKQHLSVVDSKYSFKDVIQLYQTA